MANRNAHTFHRYELLNPQDPDVDQEEAGKRILCNSIVDCCHAFEDYNRSLRELSDADDKCPHAVKRGTEILREGREAINKSLDIMIQSSVNRRNAERQRILAFEADFKASEAGKELPREGTLAARQRKRRYLLGKLQASISPEARERVLGDAKLDYEEVEKMGKEEALAALRRQRKILLSKLKARIASAEERERALKNVSLDAKLNPRKFEKMGRKHVLDALRRQRRILLAKMKVEKERLEKMLES